METARLYLADKATLEERKKQMDGHLVYVRRRSPISLSERRVAGHILSMNEPMLGCHRFNTESEYRKVANLYGRASAPWRVPYMCLQGQELDSGESTSANLYARDNDVTVALFSPLRSYLERWLSSTLGLPPELSAVVVAYIGFDLTLTGPSMRWLDEYVELTTSHARRHIEDADVSGRELKRLKV